ncbi:TMEM165/GDT1 family protein [Natrinema altunense]|uniref:TMEM165/GDT1 family protein n=1 Tax=Natrinema altunense TaxID=222984 RepID=A0A482Y1I7_9EURY|nr:TMEM165/GDT1 family protein [Natrinema altunense]RZH67965.1 TMEM165/GDT1 family protein [Natrinema altunense]
MTGWLEVLVAAFVLQLSVLPGEKVQFIIAGLATRYDPRIVVAAAASAFAGWTALEIGFGAAIQGVLPQVYLDAITAGLFLLFAVLLVRSAPEGSRRPAVTNGGAATAAEIDVSIRGYDLPPYLRGFVPIFALMAVGEFGDKTQLVTIGLAVQYGAHPAIWAGEMLAIVPVSAVNAYFFHRFSHRFDARLAHLAGAGLFLFFGLDTVLQIETGISVWETIVDAITSVILGFA